MGLLKEETRAQAGLSEQITVISFSKTLLCGAVSIYSVVLLACTQWTSPAQSWAGRQWYPPGEDAMQWLLQSTQCGAACIVQGVSLLCSDMFLCNSERKALLPASEWGVYVTQQDLPSNVPFCSNQLYPIQKTSGNLSLLPSDFSGSCPMGLDVTVQDPDCSRDFPTRGSSEDL